VIACEKPMRRARHGFSRAETRILYFHHYYFMLVSLAFGAHESAP